MALGITSKDANHVHDYQVDANGNGWTAFAKHPENPQVFHRHRVLNFVAQEAQSNCYPNCQEMANVEGAPPHIHTLPEEAYGSSTTLNPNTVYGDINSARTPMMGSSRLKLYFGHHYRAAYDLKMFKNEYEPYALDLWYEKPLYGRVDYESNVVSVYNNKFKFFNSNSRYRAVNFVVDAFEEMREYYGSAINSGLLSKDSIFSNLEVVKAYTDPYEVYLEHLKRLYSRYFGSVANTSRNIEIRTFDRFMKHFFDTVEISPTMLFNLLPYLINYKCSVNTSGLALEIWEGSKSDDYIKEANCLDPNYKFLLVTARQFGFYIDKNAPTRLVANPRSSRMYKYMQEYGLFDYKDYFDTYTYKVYEKDYDNFKTVIKQFYKSHLQGNSTIVRAKSCGNYQSGFETKTYRLRKKSFEDSNVSEREIFNYYILFRLREEGMSRAEALIKGAEVEKKYGGYQIPDALALLNRDVFNKHPDVIIKPRPTHLVTETTPQNEAATLATVVASSGVSYGGAGPNVGGGSSGGY